MKVGLAIAAMLLAAPIVAFAQEDPPGCEPQDIDTVICRWTFEARGASQFVEWDIPAFERTLATFSVVLLQSPDTGWRLQVFRWLGERDIELVSDSAHPARNTTALRHQEETTHVLAVEEGDRLFVRFTSGWTTSPIVGGGSFPITSGSFEVTYIARAVPAGIVPSRPAATLNDPHLPDESGEVRYPAWDIEAAWWDDAQLDDGLSEVHLRVASLSSIPPDAFDPPAAPSIPPAASGERELRWKVGWVVLDVPYFVEWALPASATPGTGPIECRLAIEGASEEETIVTARPLCRFDVENATMSATIPIAAIGSPPDGEPFRDPVARTRIAYSVAGRPAQPDVVDQADAEAYLFALGGPAVWSELNPRLDPPVARWSQAPLAPEHVADTLQVAGSLAALATFVVGLILIWRRRRATSRLLARVDAVAEEHVDQRQALLALGRLEEEFAGMFRRHRISEGQYQVLSQRIATVATRYALRTSLGLDDGVPGEAGPTSVKIRKV